jgi:hypothetical protein
MASIHAKQEALSDRYNQPSWVHRYVMAPTHTLSDCATSNCRANRWGAPA